METIETYLRTAYSTQVPYNEYIEDMVRLYDIGEISLEMVLKAIDQEASRNGFNYIGLV